MKQTFKTLGFLLSAIFLLTACSSSNDDNVEKGIEVYIDPKPEKPAKVPKAPKVMKAVKVKPSGRKRIIRNKE